MADKPTAWHSPLKSGGRRNDTQGDVVLAIPFSFDPTASSQVELFTLPDGARPLDVVTDGGATGGTSPTVDIGTEATQDAFAAEQAADAQSSAVADGTGGASLFSQVSGDTKVYGIVGASAATGGTITGVFYYIRG